MSQWKDISDILLPCFKIADTFFLIYVGQELVQGLRKLQDWYSLPLFRCVCIFLEKKKKGLQLSSAFQRVSEPASPKFKNCPLKSYWPPQLLLRSGRISILTLKSSVSALICIFRHLLMCAAGQSFLVFEVPVSRQACQDLDIKDLFLSFDFLKLRLNMQGAKIVKSIILSIQSDALSHTRPLWGLLCVFLVITITATNKPHFCYWNHAVYLLLCVCLASFCST